MPSRILDDLSGVAGRRRELFGREPWPPPTDEYYDRERVRMWQHCGICPKDESESCVLDCIAARKALKDGVTVS